MENDKKQRNIAKMVKGQRTIDGAGVHLTRVLGHGTVYDFDPFLMLDSFDSLNPDDYTAGFPTHPHRGIETVTYLVEGEIDHEDSLGNKGAIKNGQCQWMTAGSGILHQEMPRACPRMLGLQLWINLPQKEKMADPAYFDINESMIGEITTEEADIRVISGEYGGKKGVKPRHIDATIIDFHLKEGKSLKIDTKKDEQVFVFLMEGNAEIDDKTVDEKTAVLFSDGDFIELKAPDNSRSRIMFFSGKALGEPIAWAGPIVMNTQEELSRASKDLRSGSFIKHNAKG